MARRGGVLPGKFAVFVLAPALAVSASIYAPMSAFTGPGHGAHVIQERVPALPSVSPGKGRYAPNVCHPNIEAPATEAQLRVWIRQAGVLLHRPYSAREVGIVLVVIDGESEGRIHAINCWDRNFEEHHPSMGLIQAIDTTYMAHAPKGCRLLVLIYNPPCNIAAGTDYAIDRYGALANIPGVGEVEAGGDYQSGY